MTGSVTSATNSNLVGVVIPTLGLDTESLGRAISSALKNNCVKIVVLVVPTKEQYLFLQPLIQPKVRIIIEANLGFAPAYNTGVNFLKSEGCKFYSAIGDDDEFAFGYLDSVLELMIKKSAVAGFGLCYYVNEQNKIIFKNPSPTWTKSFLHLIPDVLPAPGAIVDISAWAEVGGLSCEYVFASDFDFWLKLRKIGKFCRIAVPMSYFRWHPNGMTARFRMKSRNEALFIQNIHTPRYQKILIPTFTKFAYFAADFLMKYQMKENYDVKGKSHD
jgi:GT2 family glycosyltransferase